MDISLHNIQQIYDNKQNKKKELYNKIYVRAIHLMKESAQIGKETFFCYFLNFIFIILNRVW